MKNLIIWIVILALLAAGLAYYLHLQKPVSQVQSSSQQEKQTLTLPETKPAPAVQNPVPEPQQSVPQSEAEPQGKEEAPAIPKRPLPALADSDKPLLEDIGESFASKQFRRLFHLKEIIQRFVVTVNNLTSKNLPRKYLLVRPVKGEFAVIKNSQGGIKLDSANYARYNIYTDLLESIDIDHLVEVYEHYYPLFQSAYEGLGYPGKYFNDRLIAVIDNLLDAPVINGNIKLVQPKVFYQFADPTLESLSAGQKVLVRMGPDNTEKVKAVLRKIRLEITR